MADKALDKAIFSTNGFGTGFDPPGSRGGVWAAGAAARLTGNENGGFGVGFGLEGIGSNIIGPQFSAGFAWKL